MRRSCAKNSCQEWVQHCLWHTGWLGRRRPMPPAATCLQPKIFGQEMIRQPIPQPIKEQPKKKPHSKLLELGRWWWFFLAKLELYQAEITYLAWPFTPKRKYFLWFQFSWDIPHDMITLTFFVRIWEMEIWFFFHLGKEWQFWRYKKFSCPIHTNLTLVKYSLQSHKYFEMCFRCT